MKVSCLICRFIRPHLVLPHASPAFVYPNRMNTNTVVYTVYVNLEVIRIMKGSAFVLLVLCCGC